jgi:hypothetical protein
MIRLDYGVRWELWLGDTRGKRIVPLDKVIGWKVYQVANSIGGFQLQLPSTFPPDLLTGNNLIEFWRAPSNSLLKFVSIGMIKVVELGSEEGKDTLIVSGTDQMDILDTKIIAYTEGSAQALKTDHADDIMKAIVRENLGASAITGRTLSAYNVTVEADNHLAPSITRAFPFKNVLTTLKEIAAISSQAGVPLYFRFVPVIQADDTIGFRFETSIYQLESNRGALSATPVRFGKDYGNMKDEVLKMDYGEERNYVYVGGEGEAAERRITEVSDPVRSIINPWNRREVFIDASQEKTVAGRQAKGNEELKNSAPKYTVTGGLLSSKKSIFGKDWVHGSKVACSIRGIQFDINIDLITIVVAKKKETITVKVGALL